MTQNPRLDRLARLEHKLERLPEKLPKKEVVAAWAVHAFTGTGAVLGLLSLFAVIEGNQLKAFLWLGLALFVDGIDGTLARRFRVKEYTPSFDGAVLDMVIDYITYAFIPALMIYWFQMVPPGWTEVAACYIAATSLYCFANVNMKTADNYFSGFPAAWNIVVLYFFILQTSPWVNLVVVGVLGLLTFVPWKYVHPLRVQQYRPATLAMTVVWSGTTFWLTFLAGRGEDVVSKEPVVVGMWIAASLYFLAICVLRSVEDGRESDEDEEV